jgi:hypothetical protein
MDIQKPNKNHTQYIWIGLSQREESYGYEQVQW